MRVMTTTGARSSLVLAEASWPQARGVAGAGARRRRAQRSASGAALLGQRCVAARSSSSDVPADTPAYEDLEAQAEAFMRQQSALETGETDEAESPTSVSYETSAAATQEYGSDEVSDDQVAVFESEALESLKLLLKNRDMTLNEVKLILAIEDPRAQEARRVYGIEVRITETRERETERERERGVPVIRVALMTNSYHQILNPLYVDFLFSALSELCSPPRTRCVGTQHRNTNTHFCAVLSK